MDKLISRANDDEEDADDTAQAEPDEEDSGGIKEKIRSAQDPQQDEPADTTPASDPVEEQERDPDTPTTRDQTLSQQEADPEGTDADPEATQGTQDLVPRQPEQEDASGEETTPREADASQEEAEEPSRDRPATSPGQDVDASAERFKQLKKEHREDFLQQEKEDQQAAVTEPETGDDFYDPDEDGNIIH